jgi:hypothetical protein
MKKLTWFGDDIVVYGEVHREGIDDPVRDEFVGKEGLVVIQINKENELASVTITDVARFIKKQIIDVINKETKYKI